MADTNLHITNNSLHRAHLFRQRSMSVEVIEAELKMEEERLSRAQQYLERRASEEEEVDIFNEQTRTTISSLRTRRPDATKSSVRVWDLQSLERSLPSVGVSKQSQTWGSNSRSPVTSSSSSGDNLTYSFLGEFPRVWINTIHASNRHAYAGCSDNSIKVNYCSIRPAIQHPGHHTRPEFCGVFSPK